MLYGVSPIGLGHATRSLAVVEKLVAAGVEVRLFSGGVAADFLLKSGLPTIDIVSESAPRVVNGEMKWTALWYLRSWFALKHSLRRTETLFESYGPDMVVCDEEFSGIEVARKMGCRNAFISDELELGFARGKVAKYLERRVEKWYKRLQDSVDLLVVPDFGVSRGNRHYVEPIVRTVTESPAKVRARYDLPSGEMMILFSMSGSRIGSFLLDKVVEVVKNENLRGAFIAISGNRGPKVVKRGVFDLGVVYDNQNLVAAADLVVSTAGKSTEDEAASAGTPFIGIPIRHHAEQERNAASLGYTSSDYVRLGELILQKLGKRDHPRVYQGADQASRVLVSAQ